jgi:hypothetical protein
MFRLKTEQHRWSTEEGWTRLAGAAQPGLAPQLVLLFASSRLLADDAALDAVQRIHPGVRILGCSTAGEIAGTSVLDDGGIATAIEFERTEVRISVCRLAGAESSRATGIKCARELLGPRLKHVLVFSEGLRVNGSELVRGLTGALPEGVAVTGGLAGDADRFERTLLYFDGHSATDMVIGIGLYGAALQVGIGSLGGWDPFGPDRLITRSHANVLYELDGEPALRLYRRYLGPHAAGLPGSGLLFPLSLRSADGEQRVVRTILGSDEANGSLTFAGDVPQGAYAQLMKANVDRLIDGAVGAATSSYANAGGRTPELAILISCVGRKLLLKQRVEEEVESVRDVLGAATTLTGFYSYGEIAPFNPSARCELHNQTMTITTLSES